MKIRKFVFAFFVLVFIISCSGENSSNNASVDVSAVSETEAKFTEQETKVLLRMRYPNHRVSIEEAMGLTEEFIDSFDGENTLKSGTNRRISSVSALVSSGKPTLKSIDIEIPDTLAYVLNFNDSLGFAIVSADTRIDYPVLAFTESGSLIDSTDNPGMAIFLDRLEDYMLNSIAEAEQQKDSLLDGILAKLGKETDTKNTVTPIDALLNISGVQLVSYSFDPIYFDKVGPLMPVEWGQGEPYNNKLQNVGCTGKGYGGKYPVGCVATAIAQMMAYWKYPVFPIPNWNWDELRQYTASPGRYTGVGSINIANVPPAVKDNLAIMFQAIGQSVKMKYDCDGSGANVETALSVLQALGFGVSPLVNYNSNYAMVFIDAKMPLITNGCSYKTTIKILGITYPYYEKCHTWVMDGHIKRKTTYYIAIGGVLQPPIVSYFDYVHNNWGWNSGSNGYFANGIFDSKDTTGADYVFVPSTINTKSGGDHNYQYNLQMFVIAR